MKKILRTTISPEGTTLMQPDAKIVSIQPNFSHKKQGGFSCWYEADPTVDAEIRQFAVINTGDDIPEGGVHRLTLQVNTPRKVIVAHVYELAQ